MALELQTKSNMTLLNQELMPEPGAWRGEFSKLSLYLMLGGSLLLSGCNNSASSHNPGDEMFSFDLLAKTRAVNHTHAEWSGKTLLINFWATWCLPCRDEMPSLQALSDDLDDEHYAVIGVSIDEDLNLLKEFLLDFNLDFPILQDSGGKILAAQMGVIAYPETIIVSPQGRIVKRISGAREWDSKLFEQLNRSSSRHSGRFVSLNSREISDVTG